MVSSTVSSRSSKAIAVAEAAGAPVLLTADPASVVWLTGFEVPLIPDPWAVPPLVLVEDDGPPTLILPDNAAEGLAGAQHVTLRTYPGYRLVAPGPPPAAAELVRELVRGRRVATDARTLPAFLAAGLDWLDVGTALVRARAVKDADELARIAAACALCDVGQAAARSAARAGASELEVWNALRGAIDLAAGGPVETIADVAGGARSEHAGGPATDLRLAEGDTLILDVIPRRAGYWGDSCSTILLGENAAARDAHARALDALQRGVAAVRPGVVVGDLDALMRAGLGYAHHTGHGVGASFMEEPHVVPDSATVLEPGMVLALEPAVYAPGFGVRVEQVVHVTADGCEVLSGHALSLST